MYIGFLLSLPDTGFVRGHHVLDEEESLRSTAPFQDLQCLLNQVAQIVALLLRIINAVAFVYCTQFKQIVVQMLTHSAPSTHLTVDYLKQVQDRQQGFVIRQQSSTGLLGTGGDQLDDSQSGTNDARIPRIQRPCAPNWCAKNKQPKQDFL